MVKCGCVVVEDPFHRIWFSWEVPVDLEDWRNETPGEADEAHITVTMADRDGMIGQGHMTIGHVTLVWRAQLQGRRPAHQHLERRK